jgi:hypothetical protein
MVQSCINFMCFTVFFCCYLTFTEELLNNFAQQIGAWRLCLYFLSSTRNDYVMMYSLTVFEVSCQAILYFTEVIGGHSAMPLALDLNCDPQTTGKRRRLSQGLHPGTASVLLSTAERAGGRRPCGSVSGLCLVTRASAFPAALQKRKLN